VAAEHIEIGAIDMAWVDESIAGWPCTAACPLQPLQACPIKGHGALRKRLQAAHSLMMEDERHEYARRHDQP
jgi:hypothetical protein